MKVRIIEEWNALSGTSYVLEIKKWWGWHRPSITYAEDSRFYSLDEANKWFDYYASDKKIDKKIIRNNTSL